MAEVHRFPEHRRELIADGGRSALRATWHIDSGYVVVSLWRGDSCVATSHLTPKEAGRLASFITGGLADLAHEASLPEAPIATATRRPLGSRIRNGARVWRESIAWFLERLARRLR